MNFLEKWNIKGLWSYLSDFLLRQKEMCIDGKEGIERSNENAQWRHKFWYVLKHASQKVMYFRALFLFNF